MDSKEIGKIIRSKREELGFTQDHVTTLTGVSKPYLSNIETGRTKNPPTDAVLHALEKALGFVPGELIALAHFVRTPSDVRESHEHLVAELERLRGVLRQLQGVKPRDDEPPTASGQTSEQQTTGIERGGHEIGQPPLIQIGRAIPIINTVAAGYPRNFPDLDYPASVADDYVRCPDVRDGQAFAARVGGDSMEPDYGQGDIVVFSPNTPFRGGDDCFVRFNDNGTTTFQRVYLDSETTVRLQPLNNRYPSQTVARERITSLWPAVYRMVRLRK